LHYFRYFCAEISASLAQLVEQLTRNEQVGGSNPLRGSSIAHCTFCIVHFSFHFSFFSDIKDYNNRMAKMFSLKTILFNPGNHNPMSGLALLLLRVSAGLMMITHGWPKVLSFIDNPGAFPDPLHIGSSLSHGLTAFAEFVCSILIVIGLGTRWAAIPLMVTMIVAAFIMHAGEPISGKEMALLYLSSFTAIMFLGAGKYSLDRMISGK
jgi:putative oxidoreductase